MPAVTRRNDMSSARCSHAVKCAIVTFLLVFYRPSVAAGINYNVFSEGHATDRRTDRRTTRRIAVGRQGRLTPNYGWEINPPPHLTR